MPKKPSGVGKVAGNAKRTNRRYTKQQVERHLKSLSREPFVELLEMFLDCPPTEEAVQALANHSPEKWARAAKQVAELAGYSQQVEHLHGHALVVADMSDSELNKSLNKALAQMGIKDLRSLNGNGQLPMVIEQPTNKGDA